MLTTRVLANNAGEVSVVRRRLLGYSKRYRCAAAGNRDVCLGNFNDGNGTWESQVLPEGSPVSGGFGPETLAFHKFLDDEVTRNSSFTFPHGPPVGQGQWNHN